jgi:SAM-dependent methyltransferase
MNDLTGLSRAFSGVARLLSRSRGPGPAPPEPGDFDEAAFRAREPYRGNYLTLCDALTGLLDFDSVLDLGCANGFLLEPLVARGKDARGVEISPAVLPLLAPGLRDRVTIASVTTLGKVGTFDLVACIEVAEHVPPAESEGLLDTIAANAGRWVYFTAATPYQHGRGHINCRPHFYWMNEFRKRGLALEWDLTERFLRAISDLTPAVWLPKNSLIFRRSDARGAR